MYLLAVKSPRDFSFAAISPVSTSPTPRELAIRELAVAIDQVWQVLPGWFQDFLLRALRSFGAPVEYPSLPFWAERAARHVLTLAYPTLRKADLNNPTSEDVGRATGHMLALISHAKAGTALFKRLPVATVKEVCAFFLTIESPIRVLVQDGLSLPTSESAAFLKGMNHAFTRTFDGVGLPIGWSTNSPVMMGICLLWKVIAMRSPSFSELHRGLAKMLGEQVLGDEDRVKKICLRLGLRFTGDRSVNREGTSTILDVPTELKTTSDK